MPYCMYLRKSRADLEAEARGEGETLARHLRTLTLLAARLDIDVAPSAIYREIVSGDTIAARPMMQRLLAEVQAGQWEGVLCTEVERLARGDTIDQGLVAQAFKWSHTKIITPAKTYDPDNEMDEEYFEFSLFMARREYKAITRRMQAGRAASVREGHYVGGRRPFGYQVVKCASGKGYTLSQIPEEARVVRMIFDLYLHQDIGVEAIAHQLNLSGVTTSLGSRWYGSTVRHMLYLPVYAGFVQWLRREKNPAAQADPAAVHRPYSDRYILAKGLHEPIISPEDFEAVQQKLKQRRVLCSSSGAKKISNPLSGILKCGLCGFAMTKRPSNVSQDFVVCRNRYCENSSTYLDAVLAVILDTLRSWVEQYGEMSAPPSPSNPDHAQEIAVAQSALDTARRQLASAKDLLERGVYSIDEFIDRRSLLSEKIKSSESEIARLQSLDRAASPDLPTQIWHALPQIRRVLAAWPYASTPADQNALLRSIFSRIDYTKTTRLYRTQDPRPHIKLNFCLIPTHRDE